MKIFAYCLNDSAKMVAPSLDDVVRMVAPSLNTSPAEEACCFSDLAMTFTGSVADSTTAVALLPSTSLATSAALLLSGVTLSVDSSPTPAFCQRVSTTSELFFHSCHNISE